MSTTQIPEALTSAITAAIAEAMVGDETMKVFVTEALNQKLGNNFSRDKETFLGSVVAEAIRAEARGAVQRHVATLRPKIEELVAFELERRNGELSIALVNSLVKSADQGYVRIELNVVATDHEQEDR